MKTWMIASFWLWTCVVALGETWVHPAKGFTRVWGAVAKGAVCLDGSPPAYDFQPGHGSGADSWLVHLRGGGWCDSISSCVNRSKGKLGSSHHMKDLYNYTGILSNTAQENPDFFNWNRAQVYYCDGASFAGEGENKAAGLYFRGERIYRAVMDDLMSRGMSHANQALLSGCSAGGVAVVLHCDKFRSLFSTTTRVKCLSDAGLFLDSIDLYGGHTMRSLVQRVVSLQGVQKILPRRCTSRLDPVSCFFPQNLINYVRTPLFLLNAAYDTAQVQSGVAPNETDPNGNWARCKLDITVCSPSQIEILQSFRNLMVNSVTRFGAARQNGLFINSCFTHCQTDKQATWFSHNPPRIDKMGIAVAVGDWYFNRSRVKKIDCAYPCDKTCINDH